jgi:transposase
MLGLSANLLYFLCCDLIDMRNGFDGLAGIVRNHLKKDPVSGDVFVFLNKTRTHIKLLYWDGDGFAFFTSVWSVEDLPLQLIVSHQYR